MDAYYINSKIFYYIMSEPTIPAELIIGLNNSNAKSLGIYYFHTIPMLKDLLIHEKTAYIVETRCHTFTNEDNKIKSFMLGIRKCKTKA